MRPQPRSNRHQLVAAFLTAGSAALVLAGLIVGISVREHTDVCSQPANLPSPSAGAFGAVGLMAAIAALVMGMVIASEGRQKPAMGVALIALPIVVIVVGAGEVAWILVSNLNFCF